MMDLRPVRIGLAGLGTVGSGLLTVLSRNADWIRRRLGRTIQVATVVDRNLALAEQLPLAPETVLSTDLDALVTNPDIDIVVELMGGITAAFTLIHKALAAGKHVVTANKALLAERGPELFGLAAQKGLGLYYEASCVGAVPIVETLKQSLAGNRISSITGILNGTANYILTQMCDKGLPFAEALKQAQDKGYAEADPTLDIQGIDAAHKLTLLIRLAYGQNLPFHQLPVEGITGVTPEDIRFAAEFGYTIKLIGQVSAIKGKLAAGVFPMLVHKHFLLASVQGSFNAVRVEGDASGPILLHGKGAGALPTGSAVLADILALARQGMIPNNTGFLEEPLPEAQMLSPDEALCPHYIHFTAKDQTGVMAAIATSMGEHGVSIRQAVQKGESSQGHVPIVFLTHEAPTRAVKAVLADTATMPFIKPATVHLRVL